MGVGIDRYRRVGWHGFLAQLGALVLLAGSVAGQGPSDAGASRPPLYDDLGDHAYPVTSATPEAQAYFDQGLRLYYAFNHAEAIRSFREAQRLDPDCAMCFWGEALAWGPNINLPMDSAAGEAAWRAIEKAGTRAGQSTLKERALIQALSSRYSPTWSDDRAPLDSAWASATADLSSRWPADLEIAVLASEAQMDLRPWDYWTVTGDPQPGIARALASLEKVQAADPDHPGACHFFIHAVEKLYPERAVPCAERLAGLMPGAGHIVHMPGHIYIRVGRYEDAIRANQHAVHADETYIKDQRPAAGMYTAGYYPHNYDFMAFAAAMAGKQGQAVEAADKLASLIPSDLLGAPGMTFLQHYSTRHLQLRVRFGLWDQILATPSPAPGLTYAQAMWHYAQGRALTATGETAQADVELERLRALTDSLGGVRLEFNGADHILRIAAGVLAGRLAAARGDHEQAIAALRAAVRLEDELLYGEPPEWTVPARHDLGAVLLDAGWAGEAEAVFRKDLEHFPQNVWSLKGLALVKEAEDEGR